MLSRRRLLNRVVHRRCPVQFSVGQVIHADPMMWGPAGGAEAVAQRLFARLVCRAAAPCAS